MPRAPWLDITRLIAMAMVAVQHVLSICDFPTPHLLFQLDLGQIGVAIFFAISGFLALSPSPLNTRQWLFRRLLRIYIPYWITVAGLLTANAIAGYKPVSTSLVISEFLGLAGWTHRGQLIGVHLWFISLLLFCYLLAALIRKFPALLPLTIIISIASLAADAHFAQHTIAFLTGVTLSTNPHAIRPRYQIPIIAIASLAAYSIHPGFITIAVAIVAIGTQFLPGSFSPATITKLARTSNLSYHFYLVHGPVYLATAKGLDKSLPATLIIGTIAAIAAALVLHKIETFIRTRFSKPTTNK
ncbi:Acyltransferase family protein [Roseimaritima multifibrata]|uniref:Acyltransferase family protein n=1 Tax=Roseimaritima multifibrata TaxID=1930274 RepID=A0A517MN77_9BACT|nr:acyltransferase [Roseimaritima multifibrata]QDS96336.1 Acyltransferase family protein [Roseimaritima multifibrata]